MKTLKTLAFMLVAVLVATCAPAGTVTLQKAYTNNVKFMVLPPVIPLSPSVLRNYNERTATNAVALGEIRRQGNQLIVAANAGTTAVTMATNTVVIGSVTNTVVFANPITIPETGLTAIDGSVYWYKVPQARNNAIVQVTVADGVVTLATPDGGALPVSSTTLFDTEFSKFSKALIASQSTYTNVNSVSVMEW